MAEKLDGFPHPSPLPEGEGVKSTDFVVSSISSSFQENAKSADVTNGTVSSPLPLGEDLSEGARESIPAHMIELAKNLRKSQTDAEKFMWQLLRNRQIANAKFRRQHPIEGYIADFYCHEFQLVIELDGRQHFTNEGMQKDAVRTDRLNQLSLTVLRFDNRQIFLEAEAVLAVIYERLKSLSSRPSPKGRGG